MPNTSSPVSGPPFLSPEAVEIVRRRVRSVLPHARIFVYGSRARGSHRPHSDLDLLIDDASATDHDMAKVRWNLMDSYLEHRVDVRLKQDVDAEFLTAISDDLIEI